MRFPKNPVLQMMWDFMHNFEVLGGRFEWNGKRARLTVSPGAAGGGATTPWAFAASVSNGVEGGAEGTVSIAPGPVWLHGGSSGYYQAWFSGGTTGSGGVAAMSSAHHMLYLSVDWSTSGYGANPTIALGNYSGTFSGESTYLSVVAGLADAESVIRPLCYVTYNTTTHVPTIQRVYHVGAWEPGFLYVKP